MASAIQLNRANLKSIAGRAQVPSFDTGGLPESIVDALKCLVAWRPMICKDKIEIDR